MENGRIKYFDAYLFDYRQRYGGDRKLQRGEKAMKLGFRKPSLSKILRAKTTGKVNRLVKNVSPIYGRKPLGFIKNPRRSVYNMAYHRVSFSIIDLFKKIFK